MRKEFGKVLRESFAAKMKAALPDYVAAKVKSPYLWPGERPFCKRVSDSLWLWIVLSPSQKDYDEFTVLVGWSTLGRYPELSLIPSLVSPTDERAAFAQPEYLTRLAQLWTTQDTWWVVRPFEQSVTTEQLQAWIAPITPEEAEKRVLPQVVEAMRRVTEFAVPYLDRYARHRLQQVG